MATSFQVSEVMKGYVTVGEAEYDRGYQQGHIANSLVVTHLTLKAADVHRFATDPSHEAKPEGFVQWDQLGGWFPIEGGMFNLFVDTENPAVKRMNYRLYFQGPAGPLTLSGFKSLSDDPRFGIWSDCAILYAKILYGQVSPEQETSAKVYGAGLIFLYKFDFVRKNLLTFRFRGGSLIERLRGFCEFSKFFLGTLRRFFFLKLRGTR